MAATKSMSDQSLSFFRRSFNFSTPLPQYRSLRFSRNIARPVGNVFDGIYRAASAFPGTVHCLLRQRKKPVEHPLASNSASLASPVDSAAQPREQTARPLPLQDQHTLSQLKRGNWSAMEELVHRYQDRLFATILRMVGHPADPADLVQEAFVRAMQNVSKFEGKSTLYTWLFRIAVNLALSHRRAQRYRKAASI